MSEFVWICVLQTKLSQEHDPDSLTVACETKRLKEFYKTVSVSSNRSRSRLSIYYGFSIGHWNKTF